MHCCYSMQNEQPIKQVCGSQVKIHCRIDLHQSPGWTWDECDKKRSHQFLDQSANSQQCRKPCVIFEVQLLESKYLLHIKNAIGSICSVNLIPTDVVRIFCLMTLRYLVL